MHVQPDSPTPPKGRVGIAAWTFVSFTTNWPDWVFLKTDHGEDEVNFSDLLMAQNVRLFTIFLKLGIVGERVD